MTDISKRPSLLIHSHMPAAIFRLPPASCSTTQSGSGQSLCLFIVASPPTQWNRLSKEMGWALSLEIIGRPYKAFLFPAAFNSNLAADVFFLGGGLLVNFVVFFRFTKLP